MTTTTHNDLPFFQETVARLSASLDLAENMVSVFSYLTAHFPLEGISLHQYSDRLKSLKLLFLVQHGRFNYVESLVELSHQEGALMLQHEKGNDVVLASKTSIDGVSSKHSQGLSHLLPDRSRAYLVGILRSGNETVGHLGFIGKEENCFTPEHERKMRLLLTPFALAMSNMLKFQRVLAFQKKLSEEKNRLEKAMDLIQDSKIVGSLEGLGGTMEIVRSLEGREVPVLIQGETGTGKELIADMVQRISPRRDAPFVKVNCGAIPESLMDSELFGYEKGAFTGAVEARPGKFEQANKGTLFLDEVGELTQQAQVRLLRVLQNGVVERLGGKKSISVDVRIITATHRNLEQMLKDGSFREDLYYRVYVFPIHVPPLRERKQDIYALTSHFIEAARKRLGLHLRPSLGPHALETLMEYSWPGNVRELENLVERAITLNPQGPLELEKLLPRDRAWYMDKRTSRSYLEKLVDERVESLLQKRLPDLAGKETVLSDQAPKTDSVASEEVDTLESLEEATRRCIEAALAHCLGRIHGPGGAAGILKINPSTLRNKMGKLGISADPWKLSTHETIC